MYWLAYLMTAKQKKLTLLVVILIPINIGFICWSLTSLTSARDARDVTGQIVAARKVIEKMPPGIERAAEFLRRLKAVDPRHASPAVKEALKDYTQAMERGYQAMTNHEDVQALELICNEKARALTDAIGKNQ